MEAKLTHDELYKRYLRSAYGPNIFPIVHVFLFVFAFFIICLTLMMNMSVITNIQTDEITTNNNASDTNIINEQKIKTLDKPNVKLI